MDVEQLRHLTPCGPRRTDPSPRQAHAGAAVGALHDCAVPGCTCVVDRSSTPLDSGFLTEATAKNVRPVEPNRKRGPWQRSIPRTQSHRWRASRRNARDFRPPRDPARSAAEVGPEAGAGWAILRAPLSVRKYAFVGIPANVRRTLPGLARRGERTCAAPRASKS